MHDDCKRYLLDDHILAEEWCGRIVSALKDTPFENKLKHAPWILMNRGKLPHAVGINKHFRLLKYEQGQFLQTHKNDLSFVQAPSDDKGVSEMSCVSVQAYLNQNFKGGFTTFLSEGRYLDVQPRTGSILLFQHDFLSLQDEQMVIEGKKCLLQTDVMYSSRSSYS